MSSRARAILAAAGIAISATPTTVAAPVIAETRSASSVIGEARAALKPPPRLHLDEWAEQKFYLSPDAGAADPGRFKAWPFQRGWMRAMSDSRTRQVTVIKSARVSYTESVKALIGYYVEHDPCPIMVIQPDEGDAKGFAKEAIEPMLRDCPAVGERFYGAASRESMLLRRFRGGVLDIVGSRSPGAFRRKGRRVIIGDEGDGYPRSAGNEGSPWELAKKRSEMYWNRLWVLGSTPTIHGASLVEREFLDGDQRRYYVPCPHCHEAHHDRGMQVLEFKHLRWDGRAPEDAVFVCIHCGAEITHDHKRWMVEGGEWRVGPHPQFPDVPPPPPWHGHASFHIWSAYSLGPNTTWGHIASEYVKAKAGGVDLLKTFVNTWLGETWQDSGEAPEWRRLYDRREDYAIGTCPAGVLFLTLGVDVQRDRLVYEVVGWGRRKESWSIDADVIMGDTSDLSTKGPWSQLDALLARAFPHASGAELTIRMAAIDSGDQTQTVYTYVRGTDPGRVIAIKGTDAGSTLMWQGQKVDVALNGKRVGKIQLWWVCGAIGKSELYGWLKLDVPTDEGRAHGEVTPPGFCHFPHYGESFFKQLTAEERVTRRTRKGFAIDTWELIPGRENHHLDSRLYARAAANRAGLDRAHESQFAAMERSLGMAVTPPPAAPSAPTTTPTPPTPARATTTQRPWLGQSRSDWLRGRG